MAIERRDPLRDVARLHERVNRLFEELLSHGDGGPGGGSAIAWRPPLDVIEEQDLYRVRADLPGVTPEAVEVRIEQDRLVLRGTRPAADGSRDAFLRVERPSGPFTAQISLPGSVDRGAIEARQKNGVLEITLPKKRSDTPSRIEVEG